MPASTAIFRLFVAVGSLLLALFALCKMAIVKLVGGSSDWGMSSGCSNRISPCAKYTKAKMMNAFCRIFNMNRYLGIRGYAGFSLAASFRIPSWRPIQITTIQRTTANMLSEARLDHAAPLHE